MPHDSNGEPLQKGDTIQIECKITDLGDTEDGQNVTCEVIDKSRQEYTPAIHLNSRLTKKLIAVLAGLLFVLLSQKTFAQKVIEPEWGFGNLPAVNEVPVGDAIHIGSGPFIGGDFKITGATEIAVDCVGGLCRPRSVARSTTRTRVATGTIAPSAARVATAPVRAVKNVRQNAKARRMDRRNR